VHHGPDVHRSEYVSNWVHNRPLFGRLDKKSGRLNSDRPLFETSTPMDSMNASARRTQLKTKNVE
jgi:hypothetical protein